MEASEMQNKLQETLNKAIAWADQHRETVASIAVVTVLVIAFAVYFVLNYISVRKNAWTKLSYGQAYAINGVNDQAIKFLDEVINSYSSTKAGKFARLYKADCLFRMKNYPEAAKLYDELVQSAPKPIVVFACLGAGYCFESMGQYSQAVTKYTELIGKYPDHFLVPRAYESLARVYEFSGMNEQAKNTYEKITTLYPGSAYAKAVQERFAPAAAQGAQQGK